MRSGGRTSLREPLCDVCVLIYNISSVLKASKVGASVLVTEAVTPFRNDRCEKPLQGIPAIYTCTILLPTQFG